MAAINEANTAGRKRKGFSRYSLPSLRIDMTPMVDLGFLLIAFFVMTAELNRPATMSLTMPKIDDTLPPMPTKESTTLSVLIGENNRLYYYHGSQLNKLAPTSFSSKDGLRKIIIEKQSQLAAMGLRDEMMMIIKPCEGATYKNLIDALDETTINNVKRYVVVKPDAQELTRIAKADK